MHNAPAVTYPMGRSHFQAGLLGVLIFAGLLVELMWCLAPGVLDWRQGVLALCLLMAGLWAGLNWQRSPVGRLRWDGQVWCWTETHTAVETWGTLSVHLDLQKVLLLCLRPETGAPLWLWPEQNTRPVRWQDLRRAVFAHQGRSRDEEATAPPASLHL